MRVTTSVYRPDEWDIAERGLIVGLTLLEVWPFHHKFDLYTLAHLSMHALGRRLQRGQDGSEEALRRDLRALGEAAPTLGDQPSGSDSAYRWPMVACGSALSNSCATRALAMTGR